MSGPAATAFQLLGRLGASELSRRQVDVVADTTLDFLRSRDIDSLYYLARQHAEGRQDGYDAVWALQRAALHEALLAWLAVGLRPVIIKGGELCERWFGSHALGIMGDIDVLLPRMQLEETKAVLYGLGYRHGYVDSDSGTFAARDVVEIGRMEAEHYELAPFIKLVELSEMPVFAEIAAERRGGPVYMRQGRPVLRLELDVHHNVASDIEVDAFFERAIPSVHGLGETFSDADHLWLNLSRHYNEVSLHDKHSLRAIAYTLPLITSKECDWAVVVAMAEEMRLGLTLYYFLAMLDRACPGHVPSEVLRRVRFSSPKRLRDWGWQAGKLFGFDEAFPAYAFDGEFALRD